WAVLVSAVVSMIIGSIWYGPLFGKKYMKAMGMNELSQEKKDAMRKSMTKSYALQFVASLVMMFVFAKIAAGAGILSVGLGLMTAFWVWIGFTVPLKLGDTLWGGKASLFWIGIFANLIT